VPERDFGPKTVGRWTVQMTSFEDRLWAELAGEHATELAPGSPPHPPKRRSRLPFAAALALLGVVLATVASLTNSPGTQAYAVTRHPDGTVTVTIKELVGIREANEQLAALGIKARAAGVEASCTTDMSQFSSVPIAPQIAGALASLGDAESASVTIKPSLIPSGDTLLLTARQIAPDIVAMNLQLFRGAVPSCIPATAASEPDAG
jgi:hypothetical protein